MRAAASAFLVLMSLASCRGEKVYVTPLRFSLSEIGNGGLCLGSEGADTFIVDLFAFEVIGDMPVPTPNNSYCSLCAAGDPSVRCRLLSRQCRCSALRNTSESILEALSGLRFEDVDAEELLCLRVTLQNAELGRADPATGPAPECNAPQACSPFEEGNGVRVCALSDLGSASESGEPILVREYYCPSVPGSFGLTNNQTEKDALCAELERRCALGNGDACRQNTFLCTLPALAERLSPISAQQCLQMGQER